MFQKNLIYGVEAWKKINFAHRINFEKISTT